MNRSTLRKLPYGEYLLCVKSRYNDEPHTPIHLFKGAYQYSKNGGAYYLLRHAKNLHGRGLSLFDEYRKEGGVTYKIFSAMCSNDIGLSLNLPEWTDSHKLQFVGRYNKENWEISYEKFKIADKANQKTKVRK